MTRHLPFVVFKRKVPLVLPVHWRKTREYRQFRAAIDRATTFRDVVELLETALRAGPPSIAADFAPTQEYARRFVNTIALYRARGSGTAQRQLADRAVRLLASLLTGSSGHTGRKRTDAPTEAEKAIIRRTKREWADILKPLWTAAGQDRRRLVRAIELASSTKFPWTEAHRFELRKMLNRRQIRPSDVVQQLTAWQLGIAVRRVRGSRISGTPPAVIVNA